jgi:hypothetical protein
MLFMLLPHPFGLQVQVQAVARLLVIKLNIVSAKALQNSMRQEQGGRQNIAV